ncbi:cpG-binding protein-like [Planoprotostelium fungivorum]|uniref:CXXC-type zinc finger protein 1 n=1 Tax=Planoprotostelium fungivorum TaxID=1890364 RepID=A0A2P6MP31_9EUKA|nr:cpG-binding protein-like [Planoprotostelium fungivorum]
MHNNELKRKSEASCPLPLRKRFHVQPDNNNWGTTLTTPPSTNPPKEDVVQIHNDSNHKQQHSPPLPTIQKDTIPEPEGRHNHNINRARVKQTGRIEQSSSVPVDVETVSDEEEDYESTMEEESSSEDSDSSSSEEDTTPYCFCRKPDHGKFMIACDRCDEWFHGECVGITKEAANRIKNWLCRNCSPTSDPPMKMGKPIIFHMHSPSTEDKKKVKKCRWFLCIRDPKQGSKYCCDECGILNARENLRGKKTEELATRETSLTGADKDDFVQLREIQEKKKVIAGTMQNIFQEKQQLEKDIQRASSGTTIADEKSVTSSLDTINCSSCHLPIHIKQYHTHISVCQPTKGRSGNKGEMCGCPSGEYAVGYCQRTKKACEKHVQWENIRRAHIDQERSVQKQNGDKLLEEERIIHERIVRRSNNSDKSSHRVVSHDEGQEGKKE